VRRTLRSMAVAVACGSVALLGACPATEEPDDPADVLQWAQANDLLTAADVEAVLGSGATAPDGWIREKACPSGKHDSLGVEYYLPDVWQLGECVIFETGEEVYASIQRDLPDDALIQRYQPALTGADIVEAVGYGEPDGGPPAGTRAVVVGTEDLVVYIGTASGEAMTRVQIDALAQTAVDKFLE
jgi:hypothetical protein